jgi:hypothetical protein
MCRMIYLEAVLIGSYIQPNFVSHGLPNLGHMAQLKAVLFVLHDRVLCRTTKFCVVQPSFVSYDRVLCCATGFCVVRPSFVLYNRVFVSHDL